MSWRPAVGLQIFFYKMLGVCFPVFSISAVVFIEVQLVHSEGYPNVFRLPKLLVGIAVGHPYIAHDSAAARVVHIVRCGDKGDVGLFELLGNCPARFGYNSFVPKSFTKAIAKVKAIIATYIHISNRDVI